MNGPIHPIFWFFVTFVDEVMKILHNLCLHFARQDRQDGKKRNKNQATKATKIQKKQKPKIGDERNIRVNYTVHSDAFFRSQRDINRHGS